MSSGIICREALLALLSQSNRGPSHQDPVMGPRTSIFSKCHFNGKDQKYRLGREMPNLHLSQPSPLGPRKNERLPYNCVNTRVSSASLWSWHLFPILYNQYPLVLNIRKSRKGSTPHTGTTSETPGTKTLLDYQLDWNYVALNVKIPSITHSSTFF